jgi:hypothetical protein
MTIAMVDQMKAGGEWSGDLARDSDSGQNRMATSALQHNVRLKNRGRRK